MYILLSSVVIDILLTLTGQCSHTMLIIGTSPLNIGKNRFKKFGSFFTLFKNSNPRTLGTGASPLVRFVF